MRPETRGIVPHMTTTDADIFVIGAGPAGLTTAYCLTKETPSVIVIEKDPLYVGGISRTVRHGSFLFDIGATGFSPSRKRSSISGRKSCRTTSSRGGGCRASTTAANSIPTR